MDIEIGTQKKTACIRNVSRPVTDKKLSSAADGAESGLVGGH